MSPKYLIKQLIYLIKHILYSPDSGYKINLTIGEYTYGHPKIYQWHDYYKVIIGKFCSISNDVIIIVDGNHRTDWVAMYPFGELIRDIPKNSGHNQGKGDIIIGNDVWIGANVLILPGVKIGDGAVIGAGSVITKSIDDYEIVAGNPAKHVRYRFNKDQIKALKRINWWNWSIKKIKTNTEMLQSDNIEEFIKKFDNHEI